MSSPEDTLSSPLTPERVVHVRSATIARCNNSVEQSCPWKSGGNSAASFMCVRNTYRHIHKSLLPYSQPDESSPLQSHLCLGLPSCSFALGSQGNILHALSAHRSGHWVWGMYCLRPLKCWGHGLESHSRHGYLCVCRYWPCLTLIPHPRSPTDCVQDQETENAAKDQQKGCRKKNK
jgi:hypothetical protein